MQTYESDPSHAMITRWRTMMLFRLRRNGNPAVDGSGRTRLRVSQILFVDGSTDYHIF